MPFCNVLTEKLNPFRREKWTFAAATANSDRYVPVRVRARACMRTEVYIYHSAGTISTCMSLYNVHAQNLIPLEDNRYCCYSQHLPSRMVDTSKTNKL